MQWRPILRFYIDFVLAVYFPMNKNKTKNKKENLPRNINNLTSEDININYILFIVNTLEPFKNIFNDSKIYSLV